MAYFPNVKHILEAADVAALRGLQVVVQDGEQLLHAVFALHPQKDFSDGSQPTAFHLTDGMNPRLLTPEPAPAAPAGESEPLPPAAQHPQPLGSILPVVATPVSEAPAPSSGDLLAQAEAAGLATVQYAAVNLPESPAETLAEAAEVPTESPAETASAEPPPTDTPNQA